MDIDSTHKLLVEKSISIKILFGRGRMNPLKRDSNHSAKGRVAITHAD